MKIQAECSTVLNRGKGKCMYQMQITRKMYNVEEEGSSVSVKANPTWALILALRRDDVECFQKRAAYALFYFQESLIYSGCVTFMGLMFTDFGRLRFVVQCFFKPACILGLCSFPSELPQLV